MDKKKLVKGKDWHCWGIKTPKRQMGAADIFSTEWEARRFRDDNETVVRVKLEIVEVPDA